MMLSKRTKATLGIFSSLAVIALAIGIWSFSTGKFQSSAQVTTCTLKGKIWGYSCDTRSAHFTAAVDPTIPQYIAGLTQQISGLTAPLNYQYAGFPNIGQTGTNIYYIMASSPCNGTYNVPHKSATSSWTSTVSKGKCTSNWSGSISIPQYEYSMSGPQLDLADNKVAYFTIKTVQNTCRGLPGESNCVHPVRAQVCNPSTSKCYYTSEYDGMVQISLPVGSWNISAVGVNSKEGRKTITSDGCNGSIQGIQIPKAYP